MSILRALLILPLVAQSEGIKVNFQTSSEEDGHISPEGTLHMNSCQAALAEDYTSTLVKMVRDFCLQEKVTIYPAVLTMVAALRYGSISTVLDGKTHTVDHDLDFMVVSQKLQNVPAVETFNQRLSKYLYSVSGVKNVFSDFSYWLNDERFAFMLPWTDAPHVLHNIGDNFTYRFTFLQIDKTTSVAKKAREGMELNRVFERFWSFITKDKNGMPDSMRKHTEGATRNVADQTALNLWFPVQPDAFYQPQSSTKVLFMGQEFPMPSYASMMHHFRNVFDDEPAAREAPLCDFSYPHGLYSSDIKGAGARGYSHAQKCAQELNSLGFASFLHCFP